MKERQNSAESNGRRTKNILVRVNGPEKDGFRAAAALAGIPLSAWVRERLRSVAINELANANKPVAFLDGLAGDGE